MPACTASPWGPPWVQAAAHSDGFLDLRLLGLFHSPGILVRALPFLAGSRVEVRKKCQGLVQAGGRCAPSPDPDSRFETFTRVSCLKGRQGRSTLQQLTGHGIREFHQNRCLGGAWASPFLSVASSLSWSPQNQPSRGSYRGLRIHLPGYPDVANGRARGMRTSCRASRPSTPFSKKALPVSGCGWISCSFLGRGAHRALPTRLYSVEPKRFTSATEVQTRTRKSVRRAATLAQPSGQVHLLGVRNGVLERAPR